MSISRYNLNDPRAHQQARIDAEKEAARREYERRKASKAESWLPTFRGAASELQSLAGAQFEVMIKGPAETGKTFACCWLVDTILRRYPMAQGALGRKIRATVVGTVLQTYLKIAQRKGNIEIYGGKDPQWIDYSNGSRLWIFGLDKPGNALSSERDIIYVNQAEEASANDWEILGTRATGRAGNMPYSMLLGDLNPSGANHWHLSRKSIYLLKSYHKDNPTLFNEDGSITPQGERSLSILSNLSEPRRSRYFLGLDINAEGQVYIEYDPTKHLIERFTIPTAWPRIRVIDFGFTNPFVCAWYAIDPASRKLYRYREIYKTQTLVEDHAKQIGECEGWIYTPHDDTYTWLRPLKQRENIIATICDWDAEDRATLERHVVKDTIAATKYIKLGIEAVQQRLKRVTVQFLKDSLVEVDSSLANAHLPIDTVSEFDGYVYPQAKDGKPNKEEPIDLNNHGLDALRYAIAFVDDLGAELVEDSEIVSYSPDYSISSY
jgi:hypothetical protein